MLLSSPIEKRIRPSVNPILICSSIGISDEVAVPGALNKVLYRCSPSERNGPGGDADVSGDQCE